MQHNTTVSLDDVIADPRWFLQDFDVTRNMLIFVRADRAVLAREPFLDPRWSRAGLDHVELPLDAVAARIASSAPLPKLHFIWHTSFCCSTVIAGLLDSEGRNLALREPWSLVVAAAAKREGLNGGGKVPPRFSEITFRLLARPEADGACVTAKPSNFANILIPDAAHMTSGKCLFLYSDIEKFLLSMGRDDLELRRYARRLFSSLATDRGRDLPRSIPEIFDMSDLEIAAIAWHLQIAEFRRSRASLAGRVASLNCDAFLADPPGILVKLDDFFELGIGGQALESRLTGPLLRRDAKRPKMAFDARQRSAEQDTMRSSLGSQLQEIVEWSYRICPDTPRGNPLSDMLQIDSK